MIHPLWCLYWLLNTGHQGTIQTLLKNLVIFYQLVLAAYKVLILGDFNIHVDNKKDTLGSAFIDILNSIGVRQHVSGPTHCRNHTLDLILSYGIDVNGVEVLQQSDAISDHYLVLCKLHIAKAVNSTPYKFGRTITSTTKDCFVSNLPDLSQFLSTSNSAGKLDDATETLFSSTLDTVAPLRRFAPYLSKLAP